MIIQNRTNIQSGEIAEKLAILAPTVKRILSQLFNKGLIEKQGTSFFSAPPNKAVLPIVSNFVWGPISYSQ